MISQTIELPLPPSVNHMNKRARGGKRTHNSDKYKSWQDEAGWMIQMARVRPYGKRVVRIVMDVGLNPKRPGRKPDLDNYIKPVLDLLQKVKVLENDSYEYVMGVTIQHDAGRQEDGLLLRIIPQ